MENNNFKRLISNSRETSYDKYLQAEKMGMEEFLTTDVTQYLFDMAKSGTYADNVCIEYMSKVLDVKFRIIHGDAQYDLDIGTAESPILTLGFLPEIKHYVSIVKTDQ